MIILFAESVMLFLAKWWEENWFWWWWRRIWLPLRPRKGEELWKDNEGWGGGFPVLLLAGNILVKGNLIRVVEFGFLLSLKNIEETKIFLKQVITTTAHKLHALRVFWLSPKQRMENSFSFFCPPKARIAKLRMCSKDKKEGAF